MADIRVTCPTCNTQLEVDATHEGEEVECGHCLQVFVATTKKPKDSGASGPGSGAKVRGTTPRSSRNDDDDRPSRRRRDDDDDYDRDDDDDYDRPRRRSGSNGMAVTALALGGLSMLSLLGSCVLGAVANGNNAAPLALGCCAALLSLGSSIGAIVTGTIGMKNPNGKGMAIAGMVLGILTIAIILVQFVIGFAIGFNGAMNGNRPNNKFR